MEEGRNCRHMGSKGCGGDGVFPWDESSAGYRVRNSSTHPTTILGACIKSLQPERSYTTKCSSAYWAYPRQQYVSQNRLGSKGNGRQTVSTHSRICYVGPACDTS